MPHRNPNRPKSICPRTFAIVMGGFVFSVLFFFVICLWSGLTHAQDVGETVLFILVFCGGATGMILRLISRLPLYSAGQMFVFGPRGLRGLHLKLYLGACVLIAGSVLLLGALDVAIRPATYRSGIGRRVQSAQFEHTIQPRSHRNP